MKLSRRRFIATSAAGLAPAFLPIGDRVFAFQASKGGAFTLPLLGDLHFDRLEHHDMEWLKREQPNDVHQVLDYSRMTTAVMPGTFREVRAAMGSAKARVPFVLQLGDFVEGVCGTPALAERHCREGVAFQQSMGLDVPFLFTKGNHDVTGPGAPEAFNRVLLPFIAGQARQELKNANYAVREGDCLFAFYDAYNNAASLPWLEQTLARREGARHVFVIIHPPVVPFNARSTWHVFSRPNQEAERKRLLSALGRNQAIVLCGHLHKYNLTLRRTDEGRFLQVALSSVIPDPRMEPRDVLVGVDKYTPDLVRLEPKHSPDTEAARREMLKAEAPFIERFEYADTAGYGMLHVDGPSIQLDIYNGHGNRHWKRLDLSGVLAGKAAA